MVINFNNYVDQTCPYCSRILHTTSAYTQHVKACRKNPNSNWYLTHQKVCPKCGKSFIGDTMYCSRSCANSKRLSSDTYKIISNKLRKHPIRYCKKCNKQLSRLNKSGLCQQCYNLFDSPLKEQAKKIISDKNKNRPRWHINRNQESYAEKFFSRVLQDYNISFQREYPVKKLDGIHCYFLDFLIIKNNIKIDLEIDGSQHKERKDRDLIRDNFLYEQGYKVYRIEWNCINSENRKSMMKNKISNFLSFLESI